MYPSSTSSSSCQSHNSTISETGLTRFGSAPGSLLRTAVDAVIGPLGVGIGGQYFTGESSDSACKVNNSSSDPKEQHHHHHHKGSGSGGGGLQRSYGLQEAFGGGSSSSSSLLRQRSSPAGFLNHLATSAHLHDNTTNPGFTITRGSGSYSSNANNSGHGHGHGHGHGVARLKSQLSFTGQDSLMTQISEVSENNVVDASTSDHRSTHAHGHGYGSSSSSFSMDPWDSSNSIVFSAPPPNKRSKSSIDGDILNCLSALDSQFSLPQTSLEMATMDKLMHIPEDSVPCKIRAKRGCATHPRSIAERERRTRISGKLKKLQELVPNMDKQTSYADMLDLAVQHIKGLQSQVQKLHKELENCTCGCKPST